MFLKTLLLPVLCCTFILAHAQNKFQLPPIEKLYFSADTHFANLADIQSAQVRESTKYRWLSYLPNPGYSPFTGGFTFSLNLIAPLQELRLRDNQRSKIEAIHRASILEANDLRNSITTDHYAIQNKILDYELGYSVDSLQKTAFDLSSKKYKSNEITPTEHISASKVWEEYKRSRQKEENAIREAINNLIYKAKMDVPASNAHLDSLNHK